MRTENSLQQTYSSSWWLARLTLAFMVVVLYGWTVFEPYAGDALMHMMDDTRIHSLGDVIRVFFSNTNPLYQEQHRLAGFHRPVFNELYLTALKEIFGIGSVWMRVMTLAMLVAIAWVFLALMRRMQISTLSGTVGATWLILSPPLFFGLYEYGLSFSHLLILLALLSLLALKKYIDCQQKQISAVWFSVALFLVLLTVFTKESAVIWPAICLLMAVYFSTETETIKNKHLPVRNSLKCLISTLFAYRWLALALAAIIIFYFSTRFIKLGSFTAISGGIEQTPSLIDAFVKFLGFSLLALQIPSPAIPDYMTQSLHHMGGVEISLRLLLFVSALWILWFGWRKSRLFTVTMFACFILAFLPIIKVSRNAPYYGDLMAIPLAIAFAFGFDALKEKVSSRIHFLIAVVIVICLFVVAAFFAGRYVANTDMWLARSQGFVRSALFDFASAEGVNEAKQIVGTSGMFSPEQRWALNHNNSLFGAALIVNSGIAKERFVLNSEKLLQNDKVMFIDFYPEMQPRKVGAYPLPGYGRLLTAYFPSGFIRQALERNDGVFNIKGYKVIRLECDNSFQTPFDVNFKSTLEFELLRRIDSAMNINPTPDKLVLEFIAPPNAVSLQLLGDDEAGCRTPKVSGYLLFEPTTLRYATTINASPRFENESDWHGKLSRNPKGDGIIVGPGPDSPNVLFQRTPVKPFEPLKIIARASSVDKPTSTGRLQINWVGVNDQFISSSGEAIEVTKEERLFETHVVAPANAIAGYLYVTPHVPNDVIRFTEVRLLGAYPKE